MTDDDDAKRRLSLGSTIAKEVQYYKAGTGVKVARTQQGLFARRITHLLDEHMELVPTDMLHKAVIAVRDARQLLDDALIRGDRVSDEVRHRVRELLGVNCSDALLIVETANMPFQNAQKLSDEFAQEKHDALQDFKVRADEAITKLAQGGVAANAQAFSEQRANDGVSATLWLVATVAVAVVALALSWTLLMPEKGDVVSMEAGAVISRLAPRLVFMSLLTFVLVWCSKNYRAARHSEVLNGHRARALQTFEMFREAAKDDETKATILRLAAEAAFTPGATGYEDPGKGGGTSSSVHIPGGALSSIMRGGPG